MQYKDLLKANSSTRKNIEVEHCRVYRAQTANTFYLQQKNGKPYEAKSKEILDRIITRSLHITNFPALKEFKIIGE